MPTHVIPLSWNMLIKASMSGVELQPKWSETSHANTPSGKLPDREGNIAKQLRSLISNASGTDIMSYLCMLFPDEILLRCRRAENICKNILNIIEPFKSNTNQEVLHVRQLILLQLETLGGSFIRKNSNISSRTISRLKKKKRKSC